VRSTTARRAAAAVIGVLSALVIAEVALRLGGVTPGRVNSGYLQFGYETGIPSIDEDGVRTEGALMRMRLFEPDPELLWRPIANTQFTNSRGMRGRKEYSEAKPPGVLRIAFVGDSCTFLGDPVYTELVEQQLSRRLSGRPVESLNFSSPGYSSLQVLRLLDRIHAWQPDAVVVYVGWNDHWPAQGGLTDRLQTEVGSGLRIVGLVRAVVAQRRAAAVNRVPLEEFRANLFRIRDTVASWGAVPIFITAPSGYRNGAVPSWAYEFFNDSYHMDRTAVDAIPAVHQQYVEEVRAVAAPPAVLVDAEADFAAAGLPAAALFRTDFIHLRPVGHRLMAALVTGALVAKLESQ
jgi:lysophospholipase L1-like esterase